MQPHATDTETLTARAHDLKTESASIQRRLDALMDDAGSLYDGTQDQLSRRLGQICDRQKALMERLVEATAHLAPGRPVPGLSADDVTRFWSAYERYDGRREQLALPSHRDACSHAARELIL